VREYRDYEGGEMRKERATKRGGSDTKLRRTTVKNASGTRSEMLPEDPMEVVKIFAERRKKSPTMRVKARLAAEAAKRIGKK
jgi:hypothetical protein